MLYFVSKLGTFHTFLANPQQNPPKTTVSPKTTQAAILTTAGRTLPVQNVTKANQYAKSTTAAPTRPSTPATTPTAPNFGDDPQTDDSSGTIALNLLLNWARLGQTPLPKCNLYAFLQCMWNPLSRRFEVSRQFSLDMSDFLCFSLLIYACSLDESVGDPL